MPLLKEDSFTILTCNILLGYSILKNLLLSRQISFDKTGTVEV